MIKTKVVVKRVYSATKVAECECLETGALYHVFASSIALQLNTNTSDILGAVIEVCLRPTKHFECVSAHYTKPLHEQ